MSSVNTNRAIKKAFPFKMEDAIVLIGGVLEQAGAALAMAQIIGKLALQQLHRPVIALHSRYAARCFALLHSAPLRVSRLHVFQRFRRASLHLPTPASAPCIPYSRSVCRKPMVAYPPSTYPSFVIPAHSLPYPPLFHARSLPATHAR